MSKLKTAEKLYDECFHLIQDNRHLTEKNELLELRMDLIRKVSQMSEQDLLDLNFALELVKQTNMLNEIEVAKANKDFYERTLQPPVSNSKS